MQTRNGEANSQCYLCFALPLCLSVCVCVCLIHIKLITCFSLIQACSAVTNTHHNPDQQPQLTVLDLSLPIPTTSSRSTLTLNQPSSSGQHSTSGQHSNSPDQYSSHSQSQGQSAAEYALRHGGPSDLPRSVCICAFCVTSDSLHALLHSSPA